MGFGPIKELSQWFSYADVKAELNDDKRIVVFLIFI